MANDNETVADIVSEMRRDAVAADAWCETHGEMASAAPVLNRHADRIEAANKREMDGLRALVGELTNALLSVVNCGGALSGGCDEDIAWTCPVSKQCGIVLRAREAIGGKE